MKATAFLVALGLAAVSTAALGLPGDPFEPAKSDSRIVRRLLATPIPADRSLVNHVGPALEMLAQPTAQEFNAYLERLDWLAVLGEPPLAAATVGDAIRAERKAEPLDDVRRRAFAKMLTAELAKPGDVLPEGVRANRERFRQASPVVWDYVEQNANAPTRLLHLALTNAGKRDLGAFHADVYLDTNPPVYVQCQPNAGSSAGNPMLKAGARRVMFCGTNWQKRVPLQALVDAAQAVAEGKATLTVKPTYVVLHQATFDMQHAEPGGFYRRPLHVIGGVDYSRRHEAVALVKDSSCFDRGTCLAFLSSELAPIFWIGPASGVVFFLVVAAFSGFRVRAKTMWIVTLVFALLPVLAFAALMGKADSIGWGAIVIPMLGAYAWASWAVGFWGAWLVSLLFRRRGAERGEVDDVASRDTA